MEHFDGGKLWKAKGREPYTTRDGREIELQIWASECVVCGAEITCKTPVTSYETSRAFFAKHCAAHKRAKDYLQRAT